MQKWSAASRLTFLSVPEEQKTYIIVKHIRRITDFHCFGWGWGWGGVCGGSKDKVYHKASADYIIHILFLYIFIDNIICLYLYI